MIPLGYEIGTGARVKIPLNHMAILGQTQLSGKTTTMEAVALRSDVHAISFITKPGEKSFRLRTAIPAFFSESTIEEYWKHVVAILEYRGDARLGWRERGVVIKLCQDYKKESSRIGMDLKSGKSKRERVTYSWKAPKTLRELLGNIESWLPYARGAEEMICIQLREYLKPAIKEIERTAFTDKLKLNRGINVMDITDLSDGLKSLVIRSVIEWVHKHGRKIVVIIPEAWKFIPEGRSTPVKLALEGLIREGAGVENFVWMDSQDLRGVDKMLLRSVIVWLFGVQRQKNEVANTLASIPDHPKPSATEIMQLGKGQFYVAYGTTLKLTYVQPAGMADAHAQAIACGDERPESWAQIVKTLDTELAEEVKGEDEDMWKEKYEALEAEHKQVIEAHDALAKRLLLLELETNSAAKKVAERVAEMDGSRQTAPSATVCGEECSAPSLNTNGNYDAVYRYVLGRASKEDPKTLAVLLDRPELRVKVERRTIEADGDTLRGALGILISEKFFDDVREFADARRELIRRGFLGSKAPNQQISQAVQGLVELGFLTKEDTGYQAVAGMKINIVEDK